MALFAVLTSIIALVGQAPTAEHKCTTNRANIEHLRTHTNYLRQVTGLPQYPISKRLYACLALKPHKWLHSLWGVRYRAARIRYIHPPFYSAWLCIHRGEGAWGDPNPPYYGGLQMDYEFQKTYGAFLLRLKGTADNWLPLEQIWVATKAYYSGRGFKPWPTTARRCGLL